MLICIEFSNKFLLIAANYMAILKLILPAFIYWTNDWYMVLFFIMDSEDKLTHIQVRVRLMCHRYCSCIHFQLLGICKTILTGIRSFFIYFFILEQFSVSALFCILSSHFQGCLGILLMHASMLMFPYWLQLSLNNEIPCQGKSTHCDACELNKLFNISWWSCKEQYIA